MRMNVLLLLLVLIFVEEVEVEVEVEEEEEGVEWKEKLGAMCARKKDINHLIVLIIIMIELSRGPYQGFYNFIIIHNAH